MGSRGGMLAQVRDWLVARSRLAQGRRQASEEARRRCGAARALSADIRRRIGAGVEASRHGSSAATLSAIVAAGAAAPALLGRRRTDGQVDVLHGARRPFQRAGRRPGRAAQSRVAIARSRGGSAARRR